MVFASLVLLTNLAFQVAFDPAAKCPAWVAYDLEPAEVVRMKRVDIKFQADPRVSGSDFTADYAGSGYDRGHMASAADFNFDRAALEETYRFTNIAPQAPELNRGAWCDLEKELRVLAESGTVHIVVFPVFKAGVPTNRIGRVAVPHAFGKLAYGWFGVRFTLMENMQPAISAEGNENNERSDRANCK